LTAKQGSSFTPGHLKLSRI